ncbi:hypothetical protein V6N13_142878 [Hibiscus sabdariffa]
MQQRPWQVRICYVARERNRTADKLAARSQSMEGVVYVIPPSTVVVLAAEDKRRWEDQTRNANLVNQYCRQIEFGG